MTTLLLHITKTGWSLTLATTLSKTLIQRSCSHDHMGMHAQNIKQNQFNSATIIIMDNINTCQTVALHHE